MMAQYDPVGETVRIHGNFSVDATNAKELAAGQLLSPFNGAVGFPVADPSRNVLNQLLAVIHNRRARI